MSMGSVPNLRMDQSAGVNKQLQHGGVIGKPSRSHSRKHKNRRLLQKKNKKHHYKPKKLFTVTKREKPLLRPAGKQVPMAPQNSTQFIMDNHENSNLFFNFDSNQEAYEHYNERQNVDQNTVNDFEHAYKFAHEENLFTSNTDTLKSAIVRLERKCQKLQTMIDARPSVLLNHLQTVLLSLQEENKQLKEKIRLRNSEENSSSGSDSDSSNSSLSDSSSSSSGSECSLTDCEECENEVDKPEDKEEPPGQPVGDA